MEHACDPRTWEAEAGGSLSSRLAWSERVPGQSDSKTQSNRKRNKEVEGMLGAHSLCPGKRLRGGCGEGLESGTSISISAIIFHLCDVCACNFVVLKSLISDD